MSTTPRAITWEAPEHHHFEKGNDWYWILGIITITATVVALIVGNLLFAIVLALSGGVVSLAAARRPRVIPFAVTVRGIRVGGELYPYPSLEAYYIDEEYPLGPQLLVRSKKLFMPLIILPLPDRYLDDVETILKEKLAEEHLEEPLATKVLEFLGF